MKVPPSLENHFIPMYENDFESLQNQRKKRNEYWKRIHNAKIYYITLYGIPISQNLFWNWLKEEYGLVPKLIDENISEDYEVVDEKLYTMFLLKFSK